MITRFAPTPSGFLHLGNAVNALLVSWLAAQHDGQVALRIDDMDTTRARPEYVADIFDVLTWLGVAWHIGPRDVGELDARFSQRHRTEHYRAELEAATARGLEVYACTCSRRELAGIPTGGCGAGCREAGRAYVPGRTALRVHVPLGTTVQVGDRSVALDAVMGDFVMWRRDDLPAYHLASVIEDRDLGTTHVVRGADLVESTAAQLFLAPALRAESFSGATFTHHDLIAGPDGTKLSKSQIQAGAPIERTSQMREQIHALARVAGAHVGINPPN